MVTTASKSGPRPTRNPRAMDPPPGVRRGDEQSRPGAPNLKPPPASVLPGEGRQKGNAAIPAGLWRTLAYRYKGQKLPEGLDAAWNRLTASAQGLVPRRKRIMAAAQRVVEMEPRFAELSEQQLRDAAGEMRALFRLGREKPADIERAFAIIREVAWRQVGLKPYPVQVAAGLAMAAGCIAELATGEGKTLAATLPATLAGWRGRGCHVITVNDYLAQRDAELMQPVYEFCGLTVAFVLGETPHPQRRAGYAADVTYTTNKEVAADFLRDRLAMGATRGLTAALVKKATEGAGQGVDQLVLRGLEYAIVDEADSILIDEAVTPLIISGNAPNSQQAEAFAVASDLAEKLEPGAHYHVNHRYREVKLTGEGKRRLGELCKDLGGIWAGARRREELVIQALVAREIYVHEKQYVVQDGKVVIVDEFTGRLMPDREWRDGLHQAVSAKEKVEVQPPKETLARISFQNFYRMYRKLSGMTATAWEARAELWQIYRLPVVPLPTHRPCHRRMIPDRVYANPETKWRAIADRIRSVNAQGQPILVGTRSVQASELLSRMLASSPPPLREGQGEGETASDPNGDKGEIGREVTPSPALPLEGEGAESTGVPHQILNAVRHKEEAAVVAHAGGHGKVTVATNMAGRGTDIKLAPGVEQLGGLHVIATERHESGRVDRQLFGRCARQGDPGVATALVCVDDELLVRHGSRLGRIMLKLLANGDGEVPRRLASRLIRKAQRRAERQALRQRKMVMKTDSWLDQALGFAGVE